MFRLSAKSIKKLNTCHPDIVKVISEAIMTTMVDFGIREGERTLEKQQEYFAQGITTKDGITSKSKHQHSPARAVDIYAYYSGEAHYDDLHMGYLAGHIMGIANRMYKSGEISHKFRWGGNWNGNGILVYDQNLKDLPHYEIV